MLDMLRFVSFASLLCCFGSNQKMANKAQAFAYREALSPSEERDLHTLMNEFKDWADTDVDMLAERLADELFQLDAVRTHKRMHA
jgi:hypothetical protein